MGNVIEINQKADRKIEIEVTDVEALTGADILFVMEHLAGGKNAELQKSTMSGDIEIDGNKFSFDITAEDTENLRLGLYDCEARVFLEGLTSIVYQGRIRLNPVRTSHKAVS